MFINYDKSPFIIDVVLFKNKKTNGSSVEKEYYNIRL